LKFSPTSELYSGYCRFSVHRGSLPDFRTATFARFCPPLGLSVLPGGTRHCRLFLPPYPFSGLRGFRRYAEVPVGFERCPACADQLAPLPLWDLFPSEISPSDQLPPFRVSCSPAFSQGCEALLQSEVPGRGLHNCNLAGASLGISAFHSFLSPRISCCFQRVPVMFLAWFSKCFPSTARLLPLGPAALCAFPPRSKGSGTINDRCHPVR